MDGALSVKIRSMIRATFFKVSPALARGSPSPVAPALRICAVQSTNAVTLTGAALLDDLDRVADDRPLAFRREGGSTAAIAFRSIPEPGLRGPFARRDASARPSLRAEVEPHAEAGNPGPAHRASLTSTTWGTPGHAFAAQCSALSTRGCPGVKPIPSLPSRRGVVLELSLPSTLSHASDRQPQRPQRGLLLRSTPEVVSLQCRAGAPREARRSACLTRSYPEVGFGTRIVDAPFRALIAWVRAGGPCTPRPQGCGVAPSGFGGGWRGLPSRAVRGPDRVEGP